MFMRVQDVLMRGHGRLVKLAHMKLTTQMKKIPLLKQVCNHHRCFTIGNARILAKSLIFCTSAWLAASPALAAPRAATATPAPSAAAPEQTPAPTTLPAGARSITLTEAELNREVVKHFPLHRSVQGLLQLSLLEPRLKLLPETGRIGIDVTLRVAEPFTGKSHDGQMQLSHGLRYEPSDRSLRMTGVQVQQVSFASLREPYRGLLSDGAPQVVEQALADMPLHRLEPEQLAVIEGLGYAIGEFQVTPAGLRVVLLPALATAPAPSAPSP